MIMLGQAKQGTISQGYTLGTGERAKKLRTAGGTSINSNWDIWETVQTIGLVALIGPFGLPYEYTKQISEKNFESASKYLDQNPQIKEIMKTGLKTAADLIKSGYETGKDLLTSTKGGITGALKLIEWLPYIVVGTLVLGAVFVLKNPQAIKKII